MPDENADELTWDNVTEKMAAQIVGQGEKYLQAQLDVALAADMRAVTIASIFATFSTAILGVSLAFWDDTKDVPILLAGLTASLAMGVGAGLGFWSARPRDFYFPGNHPAQWWQARTIPLKVALGGEAENYQKHIVANERILKANASTLKWGAGLATASPLIAFVVWGLATWICL